MYTEEEMLHLMSIMNGKNTIYDRPTENEFEELANWMCIYSHKTIAILCGSMKTIQEYRKLYDYATKNENFKIFNVIDKNTLNYLEYKNRNRVIFALSVEEIRGQGINYLLIGNEAKTAELENIILPTISSSARNIIAYIKEIL